MSDVSDYETEWLLPFQNVFVCPWNNSMEAAMAMGSMMACQGNHPRFLILGIDVFGKSLLSDFFPGNSGVNGVKGVWLHLNPIPDVYCVETVCFV